MLFKVKMWKRLLFTSKIATYAGFSLLLFILLLNSNVLFTFGYQFESNATLNTQCFATIPSTYWMAVWNNVIFILISKRIPKYFFNNNHNKNLQSHFKTRLTLTYRKTSYSTCGKEFFFQKT